jgi:alpha-1,6-mannosyltransferase
VTHPSEAGRDPARAVDVCGALSCGAWVWLAAASRGPLAVPLPTFFAVLAVAWAALLAAFVLVGRCGGRISRRRVLVWALTFRLIGLAGEPVLEDDHFRYLWDGRATATTGNPYATAPIDHFEDDGLPDAFQAVLDGINHPDVPTVYGPVCQVLFAVGYALAPAELLPIKVLLVALDLLALWLLFGLTPPGRALLYAWCPLLVIETAFTGHVDAAGVALLVAALYASTRSRDGLAGALLATAVAVKPLALLAAPFLLWRGGRAGWISAGATALALHLPFALAGGGAGAIGLGVFLGHWEFNSTGFAAAAALAGPRAARLICALVFLVFYAAFTARFLRSAPPRSLPRLDLVFGVFFLLSPVANPWYLLWMLPFVALTPSAWGVAALAVVSLSYVHGLYLPGAGLPPYHHPHWVRPLEVAVVAAAALWPRVIPPVRLRSPSARCARPTGACG